MLMFINADEPEQITARTTRSGSGKKRTNAQMASSLVSFEPLVAAAMEGYRHQFDVPRPSQGRVGCSRSN